MLSIHEDSEEDANCNDLLEKFTQKGEVDNEENDPTYKPEEDQHAELDETISDTSIDEKEIENLAADAKKEIIELIPEEIRKEIFQNGLSNGDSNISPKENGKIKILFHNVSFSLIFTFKFIPGQSAASEKLQNDNKENGEFLKFHQIDLCSH